MELKARMIFEVLGRPVERVKEALTNVIVTLSKEPGVTLLDKKYHEPTLVKDSKDLYTAFAEVEIECKKIQNLFGVIMMYFPSNLDIYEPDNFKMDSSDLTELSNFLISRMHHYDGVVKNVVAERDFLMQKMKDAGMLTEDNKFVDKKDKAEKKNKKGKKKKE